jgi:hypothetical protein
MTDPDTCVAYLVRSNEGLAPVQRFLDAYSHVIGLPHRLLVLGDFTSEQAWEPYAAAFEERGVNYDPLDVADAGFDLGAYGDAVQTSPADTFCFLNTFSEVLCDGWLAHLHRAAHLEGAGLVGATGSYESMYSGSLPAGHAAAPRLLRRAAIRGWLRVQALRRDFAPFPNPHIRTNAFMLRRTLALSLRWGPYRTKADVYRSESGRSGFSSQARAAGLRNLVVDRDGRSYESHDWPESDTFRYREQSRLMIADNRTRDYAAASASAREHLGRLAWGTRYCPPESTPQ